MLNQSALLAGFLSQVAPCTVYSCFQGRSLLAIEDLLPIDGVAASVMFLLQVIQVLVGGVP